MPIHVPLLIGAGAGLLGKLWGPEGRSTEIEGREERSKRLLAAGQDAYGREGYQAPAWEQQMQTIGDLRQQATEGDPIARDRLMQAAGQQASRAQGAALSAGPQNQALMARAALGQSQLGMRHASKEAWLADELAKRNARVELARATQELGRQQGESETSQRGIGADLLSKMSQLEQQQALAQAELTASQPSEDEQLMAMGLGGFGSLAAGGYFNKPTKA